jgi:hypothetical protein
MLKLSKHLEEYPLAVHVYLLGDSEEGEGGGRRSLDSVVVSNSSNSYLSKRGAELKRKSLKKDYDPKFVFELKDEEESDSLELGLYTLVQVNAILFCKQKTGQTIKYL